ncbi:MAG: hypothetical protein LBS86_05390 [Treponema sp.]|jgi:hypothetical protein|nr:hypothetical protein [Treponema sp.]
MGQETVLQYCYDALCERLAALGETSGLFALDAVHGTRTGASTVRVGIADVSQVAADRNGVHVVVDERLYAAPTRIACVVALTVSAERYTDALATLGMLVKHFKEQNTLEVGAFNWHGNTDGMIYLEPLLREPERRPVAETPVLTLEYRFEVGINAEQSEPVHRVEQRSVHGVLKP